VAAAGEEAARRPKLAERAEIMAPLAPYDEPAVRAEARVASDAAARAKHFGTLPRRTPRPPGARSPRTSTPRCTTNSCAGQS